MKKFATLAAFLCAPLSIALSAPARALLIDGAAAGHDWKEQTPALKAIFESNSLFQVEVVTASESMQPALDRYKVVILNYGGDALPMSTLSALEKYVSSGGGLVALPGAGSAFPKDSEYNLILGVRAGSPDQSAGPVWFYKDGNVAFDTSLPPEASQTVPAGQPFLITVRNTEHPVTKGLPLEWMHTADDLVGNLRGPGKNMTMLATALSDASKGGTGRNEPQIIAVTYGKGRVFHSILGRTSEALQCAGLQTMLQRGAEWAATGKVTQKLPSDFPDEEKVSRRPK